MISISQFRIIESFQSSDTKLSKEEEMKLFNDSPIAKVNFNHKGWKFSVSIHSGAQALQRRPDLEVDDWKKIETNVIDKLESLNVKKTGDYLFYSRSFKQGLVCAVDFGKKVVRIITVLPENRGNPKPGTQKMMVECACDDDTFMVDVNEIELEDFE